MCMCMCRYRHMYMYMLYMYICCCCCFIHVRVQVHVVASSEPRTLRSQSAKAPGGTTGAAPYSRRAATFQRSSSSSSSQQMHVHARVHARVHVRVRMRVRMHVRVAYTNCSQEQLKVTITPGRATLAAEGREPERLPRAEEELGLAKGVLGDGDVEDLPRESACEE